MTEAAANRIWVLADPRAGTAAQAIGIAERLGRPFRTVPLDWGPMARLPLLWATRTGLTPESRRQIADPWPDIAISAGRRSAPVALWLAGQGVRTVHCMRPGFGEHRFDLLVVGRHDSPPAAPNILPILGATHRMSPARLAAARREWGMFGELPGPRIALLLGGPPRGEGMAPGTAATIARQVAGFAGSVVATGSRRTGRAAESAVAEELSGLPHHLHRWGDGGRNPYAGMLAWADAVVVTGDSVSMLSEALATTAPVFIADPGGLGARHHRLHDSVYAAGQARPLAEAPTPFARDPFDETGRVAFEIAERFLRL
ncbi:mitochondrial fission ELM1 family protein [Roseomonas sp. CAU 1739]|uniref:mitochondrial fission ELM1 family protein n=1 Tax=Roseomonas sp. CAU 1739 TaxID=3140364 RepID=UPI00325BF4F2